MTKNTWTQEDEQKFLELLKKFPKNEEWKYPIFRELVMFYPYPSVEVILLKREGIRTLVHLVERDVPDPDFAGQVHFPGSVLRNSDTCWEDAINRVVEKEMGTKLVSAQYVGYDGQPPLFINTPRGKTTEIIFICEVENDPLDGDYYDVDNLPSNLIPHQLHALKRAVEYYKKQMLNLKN